MVHVYPNFTERFRLFIVIEAQFEFIKRKYSEQFPFNTIKQAVLRSVSGLLFGNALNTLQGNLYKIKAMWNVFKSKWGQVAALAVLIQL